MTISKNYGTAVNKITKYTIPLLSENNFLFFVLTLIKYSSYLTMNLLWIVIFVCYNISYNSSIVLFFIWLLLLLFITIIAIFLIYYVEKQKKRITIFFIFFCCFYYIAYESNIFLIIYNIFPSREKENILNIPLVYGFSSFMLTCYICVLVMFIYKTINFIQFSTLVMLNAISYFFLFIGMGIFSNKYKYFSLGASSDVLSYEFSNFPYPIFLCVAISLLLFFFENYFSYYLFRDNAVNEYKR